MQETGVPSLGQKDPLQKEMATHSSILAWEIPWTEEPGGGYSPQGCKKGRSNIATKQSQCIYSTIYTTHRAPCLTDCESLEQTAVLRTNSDGCGDHCPSSRPGSSSVMRALVSLGTTLTEWMSPCPVLTCWPSELLGSVLTPSSGPHPALLPRPFSATLPCSLRSTWPISRGKLVSN